MDAKVKELCELVVVLDELSNAYDRGDWGQVAKVFRRFGLDLTGEDQRSSFCKRMVQIMCGINFGLDLPSTWQYSLLWKRVAKLARELLKEEKP